MDDSFVSRDPKWHYDHIICQGTDFVVLVRACLPLS